MTKKMLNQNAKYDQRFIDKLEPKFEFSNKPINRLKVVKENSIQYKTSKNERILRLKKKINSIKNCNLRDNSKKNKDWETADIIRDKLSEINIQIKDTRDGTNWELNE